MRRQMTGLSSGHMDHRLRSFLLGNHWWAVIPDVDEVAEEALVGSKRDTGHKMNLKDMHYFHYQTLETRAQKAYSVPRVEISRNGDEVVVAGTMYCDVESWIWEVMEVVVER